MAGLPVVAGHGGDDRLAPRTARLARPNRQGSCSACWAWDARLRTGDDDRVGGHRCAGPPLAARRARRVIRLSNHDIVCDFGQVGRQVPAACADGAGAAAGDRDRCARGARGVREQTAAGGRRPRRFPVQVVRRRDGAADAAPNVTGAMDVAAQYRLKEIAGTSGCGARAQRSATSAAARLSSACGAPTAHFTRGQPLRWCCGGRCRHGDRDAEDAHTRLERLFNADAGAARDAQPRAREPRLPLN